MKKLGVLLAVLLVVLILGVSGNAKAQLNSVIIVTEIVSGSATVQAGTAEDMLVIGDEITTDTVIAVEDFATVTVLCPDGMSDTIDVSRAANCSDVGDDALVINYRGLDVVERLRPARQPEVVVLTPRNTRLLYGNPRFEWTAANIDGATYKLIVTDMVGQAVWSLEGITSTMIDYPENQQAFLRAFDEAGNSNQYLVRIEVFDVQNIPHPVGLDSLNVLPITVATPDERAAIEAELGRFDTAQLPSATADSILPYLRARYLFDNGYYADALDELNMILGVSPAEPSPSQLSTSPHLYVLLGDIYSATSLPAQALEAYQRGLEFGTLFNHIRSQAYLYERVAQLSSQRDERRTAYQLAQERYFQIGDADAVLRIATALENLN